MSSGSKPAVTSGLPYCSGTKRYGPVADDGRHVAGPEEAVEAQVGRLEDGLDRRHDRHVVAEHAEVGHAELAGAQQRDRGRRRRGLEPDREEHDLAVGVLDRDAAARRAASRRSARRRRAPWLRAGSRCCPGTRIMSPNDVKITPGVSATAIASSTRPIGITHTGQPGRAPARRSRAARARCRGGRWCACARRTPP